MVCSCMWCEPAEAKFCLMLYSQWLVGELIHSITPVDYGNVGNGQTSTKTISIRNDGSGPLVISGVTVPAEFTIISGDTGILPSQGE